MDWAQWLFDLAGYLLVFLESLYRDAQYVVWLCIPWLAANMLPVVLGRNGHPIHANFFGPNKTWQGLLGGAIGGTVIGIIAVNIAWYIFHSDSTVLLWGDDAWTRRVHIISLATGALIGDVIKSYFKRQRGIAAGMPWPYFDQLDAPVGAFVVCGLCDLFVTGGQWFAVNLIPGRFVAILALVPVYFWVHRLSSQASHQGGLKSHPH